MKAKTNIGAALTAWFDDAIATGERIAADVKRLRALKRQAGVFAKVASDSALAEVNRRLDRVERVTKKRGRAT